VGAGQLEVGLLRQSAVVQGPNWLIQRLGLLFAPRPAFGGAVLRSPVELHVAEASAPARRYRLIRDGELFWETDRRSHLLASLEWTVGNALVDRARADFLLLHAAVAATEHGALLLPAGSGGGKSTLVAGLMSGGWRYLSDEVAALELCSGLVAAFPRSVSLKLGGRQAVRSGYPAAPLIAGGRRFGRERIWYLPPPPDAVPASPLPVRWIVLPSYRAGETVLSPLRRSEVLPALLAQSFNLGRFGAAGIERLVRVVAGATCYRLTSGDLAQAVQTLGGLAASAAGARPPLA
jgi:HprK-related kinase A